MLSFVGQVRPAIFHLRDLRVGIPRIFPIFVRGFLLALAVQARQLRARGRRDPRRLRETGQELLIALPGVAAHDATHGRVRLEHGGVNRDRLALEQARRHQPLLHPREDGAVTLEVDDAPRPGNRRMIRRRLVHRQPQKTAHRQRVARAPGDPAFRVDPFKVADQQQPEVPTRRQARPSHHRRVEPRALAFDKPIEVGGVQQRTQPRVERMPRRLWQLRRRHPQRPLLTLSGSHRHATHCSTANRFWRSFESLRLSPRAANGSCGRNRENSLETAASCPGGYLSLRIFSEPNVRLVILDDQLVQENDRGWLLGQIRKDFSGCSLLYVTNHHSEHNEKRARTSGVHYYTSKPISDGQFARVLQSFLQNAAV